MSQWYNDVVDNFITLEQARQDALLVFVLRCADRAGQQVASYEEYVTNSFNYKLGHSIAWHRVKITFVDGRHVRGWRYAGRWQFGDRTWDRYNRHGTAAQW